MEKEILKETVSKERPVPQKKKSYKPRKKKETKQEEFTGLEMEMIQRSGEVPNIKGIQKQVGYYKIGKSFHIFFEEKPKAIYRFFTKLLLGWKWHDQK
jgi:uncharacterized metal-binding protein